MTLVNTFTAHALPIMHRNWYLLMHDVFRSARLAVDEVVVDASRVCLRKDGRR